MSWPATVGKVIKSATTIVVAASGGDFTTLAAAITYVGTLTILNDAIITIQINDGAYAISTALYLTNYNLLNTLIQGQHNYKGTVNSVQSSSGSAGAWSIVLNVDSVAHAAVNDWIAITAPSGGTKPTFLAGAFQITNVDVTNTRITISSQHKNATAPSGAVSATLSILKTVLNFSGCDGFRIWNNICLLCLDNVMVTGGLGYTGINVQDGSRVVLGYGPNSIVGISGFSINVLGDGAQIGSNGPIVSSNGSYNFQAQDCGKVSLYPGSVSSAGGAIGIYSTRNGSVEMATGSITTGNSTGIYSELGGVVNSPSGNFCTGNTTGMTNTTSGYCNALATITFSDNTKDVALNSAYVGSFTATLTGCTTSPTVTILYSINGGVVSLWVPTLTGTSNGGYCSITGIPALLVPVNGKWVMAIIEDNGANALGMLQISTTFYLSKTIDYGVTIFTTSGIKGIPQQVISYSLQ